MSSDRTSRIPGFYRLPVAERLAQVAAFGELTDEHVAVLADADPRRLTAADKMIENVIGLFHLPVGVAANFRIDDVDRLLPMVIEEASVVAAASNAAKLLRGGRGIVTDATPSLMIGQIQLCDLPDVVAAAAALEEARPELVQLANDGQPRLVGRGGGARDLEIRVFDDTEIGPMVVVHVLVDVCDAMGANLVNGMAESLAPECERLSGGTAYLRILSNLADRRLVRATGRIPLASLGRDDLGYSGADVADRIVKASVFAEVDPYRATTHNKGIMNGVDAFLLATGQDWRAMEAGAHAFCSAEGRYTAMATWRREGDELVGRITLPVQVGVVGGIIKVHPTVKALVALTGARTAADLGRLAASVGLAQNLAAIMALATEGIQRGHMSLHARNIAAAAGARDHEIERIVAEMIRRKTFTHAAAASILDETKKEQADDLTAAGALSLEELQRARDAHWPEMVGLIERIQPRGGEPGSLADLFWYQLDTGGKRLRAALPLLAHEAVGGSIEDVSPFGAALELLHNGTLVHDDAEARTRRRRGHETLWVRYGTDQAINTGDALAWTALQCLDHLPHADALVRRVQRMTVEHMRRVVAAQMASRRGERDLSAWLELTADRTGGLFALALEGAAALAEADEVTTRRLSTIGGHLGIIFQVQDELLDIIGDADEARPGRALIDGGPGLLLTHALEHARGADAEALKGVLSTPRHARDERVVRVAISAIRGAGSLTWAGDIIRTRQDQVAETAAALEVPAMERVVAGITDVFLQPLLARLDE